MLIIFSISNWKKNWMNLNTYMYKTGYLSWIWFHMIVESVKPLIYWLKFTEKRKCVASAVWIQYPKKGKNELSNINFEAQTEDLR